MSIEQIEAVAEEYVMSKYAGSLALREAMLKEIAELRSILVNVQQDINWMCNEEKVLNRFVFDYLDNKIEEFKGE